MTPAQKLTMQRLTPPSGKLLEALRRKYKSPRECMRALGLDAALLLDDRMAFDQEAPRFSKARAVSWLLKNGFSEADCDEFLSLFDGGGAEAEDDGHGPTESQHNALERTAHTDPRERVDGGMPGLSQSQRMSSPMELDELPENGMPRAAAHAMDSSLPRRTAACRIAPGLENIRLGVLGW